jgi:Kef-type K+ transport system membrane component KefB
VEQTIFLQLSLVLAIAAGVSIVMRMLRQPLIIGYIISGVLCGPGVFSVIHDHAAFESFSQIGIALLLFIVGLGLNIGIIRNTGKPVFLVFAVNLLLVGGIGYGVGHLFGLKPAESVLVALGLLFSSTIVVIKSLSDKREQNRLYGQITIGVLLLEDLLATFALLFVATARGGITVADVSGLLGKGILLAAGLILAGAFVMPRLAKFFAASQEFLFTFALAWAFSVASIFQHAGFSIEVGALFAGVTLASLPYAQEISSRLKPLRDFFLVLFFISLGERLDFSNIHSALVPALVLSVVAIFIKPFAVSLSLGVLGYTKQTGFKTAAHLSQISEFSIILVVLAQTTGLAGHRLTDILTLTAMLTIAVSSYLMKYDDELYRLLEKPLSVFERHNTKALDKAHTGYKLVLFGYHKGGHEFVKAFRDMHKRYIVIDYNPDVIETLEHQHINHVYGDATDYELLEEIGIKKSEMVVSTISDFRTNALLLSYVLADNEDALFVCHANDYDDAAQLYESGAAYVMLPHFIGSERMSNFIRKHGGDKEAFDKYRQHHIMKLGQAAIE